jgi:FecR protein
MSFGKISPNQPWLAIVQDPNSFTGLLLPMKITVSIQSAALAILLAIGGLLPSVSGAAESVGRVLFAIGDAKLAGGNAVKKGDTIEVGQTVTTGANGHVHIRFVDEAFVSVRPNSSLTVEQYEYDSKNPANNKVRFNLTQGVARLITGKAGQAAKENFRLNTPVAAIGIRGTDFLVQAKSALTRVAVQQGAIVISPFSESCARSALGSCGDTNARELVGSLSGIYLEVKGTSAPTLVTPPNGRLPFELPRPEEPKVNVGGDTAKTAGLPEGMSGSTNLMWGRWSGRATAPAGYETVGHNDALVLFRTIETGSLPTTGFVLFQLQESEAYGRHNSGVYEPASVSAGSFSVNFDKMKYATNFVWEFDGKEYYMYSKGSIKDNGRMAADRSASNVALSGALNSNGQEAAYIYFKNINNDLKAYGILRWER